ncbi:hypothetical protein A1O3_02062 [Capronia epimyces CBS 606.96]|uniref:Catabolic 3-dehydroquinase n=1 Tax=Capronia epimyces CBS 606.96 TaxID=1182542 RepID=W9Y8Z2_9EURO|nr:uncharacterized protein A1O3_02062 [Capronia epimyces CBS 606.96]EXJ88998.1 hypothetical protein A1O3_02062 [Capronia epimyces CBS 606.96]
MSSDSQPQPRNPKTPRKILLINGPNLNLLGHREPHLYGSTTLAQVVDKTVQRGNELGVTVVPFQSNHEGAIVDFLHEHFVGGISTATTIPTSTAIPTAIATSIPTSTAIPTSTSIPTPTSIPAATSIPTAIPTATSTTIPTDPTHPKSSTTNSTSTGDSTSTTNSPTTTNSPSTANSKPKIAVIINPAAYTHTSVAIRDALLGTNFPFVEVHISNVHAREPWRHHSYFSDKAVGVVVGLGVFGYQAALQFCVQKWDEEGEGGDGL